MGVSYRRQVVFLVVVRPGVVPDVDTVVDDLLAELDGQCANAATR